VPWGTSEIHVAQVTTVIAYDVADGRGPGMLCQIIS
jgi:hypothetical protein